MTTPLRTDPAHRPSGWGSFENLPTGRTLVMGILNVTPDSFSDGGEHAGHEAAIAHGLRMMAEGADIVDVGGESTRPGSERIDPAEERRRILPVVEALAAAGAVLSVDTLHAGTAEAVLDAGAHIVNDVSGLRASQDMIDLVAERQAPYVLMHARGLPDVQDSRAVYDDVAGEVLGELEALTERCLTAGLARAKTGTLNTVTAALAALCIVGLIPMLGRPLAAPARRALLPWGLFAAVVLAGGRPRCRPG